MPEELKPCPMCKDTSVDYYYEDDNEVSVLCRQCGFETRSHLREKSAAREWNALPRRLRWTKEKPTKPGWYWFRYPNGRKFVWHVSGDVVTSHKGVIMALDKVQILSGEWAGPLPEPED